MSDDIVNRLREHSGEVFTTDAHEAMVSAADEIERLNTLVDNLQAEIQYYQSLQRN